MLEEKLNELNKVLNDLVGFLEQGRDWANFSHPKARGWHEGLIKVIVENAKETQIKLGKLAKYLSYHSESLDAQKIVFRKMIEYTARIHEVIQDRLYQHNLIIKHYGSFVTSEGFEFYKQAIKRLQKILPLPPVNLEANKHWFDEELRMASAVLNWQALNSIENPVDLHKRLETSRVLVFAEGQRVKDPAYTTKTHELKDEVASSLVGMRQYYQEVMQKDPLRFRAKL